MTVVVKVRIFNCFCYEFGGIPYYFLSNYSPSESLSVPILQSSFGLFVILALTTVVVSGVCSNFVGIIVSIYSSKTFCWLQENLQKDEKAQYTTLYTAKQAIETQQM